MNKRKSDNYPRIVGFGFLASYIFGLITAALLVMVVW